MKQVVFSALVLCAMTCGTNHVARAGAPPGGIDGGAVWTALAVLAATPDVGIGIGSAPTGSLPIAEAGAISEEWSALMPADCQDRDNVDCVALAMEASGASDAAVRYERLAGHPLLKFWRVGPVDLGLEAHSCADCPPGVWVLLNGAPEMVYPSCGTDCVAVAASPDAADPLPLSGEPGVQAQFEALSAAEPHLLDRCGPPNMELESDWDDPDTGDQIFLFQQRLSGPSAGCTGSPGYRLRFAAEFQPDGTPVGERAVGFCEDQQYPLPNWPIPLPACPVPMIGYDTLNDSAAQSGGPIVLYPAGWNLVAGPNRTAFPVTLYGWRARGERGSYYTIMPPTLIGNGFGAWAYFAAPTPVTLAGAGFAHQSWSAPAGQWFLVGDPSGTQTAMVSGADAVYTYDPAQGYQQTTTLEPGKGAWVWSADGATVRIATTSLSSLNPAPPGVIRQALTANLSGTNQQLVVSSFVSLGVGPGDSTSEMQPYLTLYSAEESGWQEV